MNRDVYRHLLQTYAREPGWWFGVVTGLVKNYLLRVWAAILMAQTAADLAGGDMASAKHHVLLFFIAYTAGPLVGAIGEWVAVKAENQLYGQLMERFFIKLTGKDMSFFRDNQSGYLAGLFRQYLDGQLQLVRLVRGEFLGNVVSLTIPAIVLWAADWRLGAIAVAIIMVQVVYIFWASSKANEYRKVSHEMYRKITGEVADIVTNVVAFKSGRAEAETTGNFAQLRDKEIEAFNKRRKLTILLDIPRAILTAFGVTLAFYVVLSEGNSDPATVGLIVLTLTYMFQIVRNVAQLPELMLQLDDYITKLHPTLIYLSETYEDIRDPEKPKKLGKAQGAIQIENVEFSYPSRAAGKRDIKVFNDLNISIKAGEHIGIVGLSGAGKSTLASLLMRFDDIQGGSIKIDGIDIREMTQSDLRDNIAYVPQEPLLFHRSVGENIAYFRSDSSQAKVVAAAKAAHAHEFISKLPSGYDTVVGERGIKLSGGQKQRVVIARAILKKAPIMIFDEATSALDSESEQIIQKAMPEIIGKQTAIVIAHRLSTVAGLDRIIVMHDGQVVEQGTHRQLLKLEGRYYDLWQRQTSGHRVA
jgi:ATP-binding cassette subfamily B protein